ncbi:hypothetical protein [Streptomyces sp. NBC_00091]|uniref:hypothetical protein n=1 Tax=Streptomyces sp. NBC_00091 TaxID=2975648 RepID=UPI0022582C3F|nr:hypothetical protein [Streptomyces sp. NBC_00091]MCX5380369.1 hypothetical protein [Streptomyces sp. NBC_00091]
MGERVVLRPPAPVGSAPPKEKPTGNSPLDAPPSNTGFAHPKNWRILAKLRTDPARATHLLRALLVLTNLEVNR